MRIWGIMKKKQKIKREYIVEANTLTQAVHLVCEGTDTAHPMLLPRHERDFDAFGRAVFRPDEFVEAFPFDALEIIDITPKEEDRA